MFKQTPVPPKKKKKKKKKSKNKNNNCLFCVCAAAANAVGGSCTTMTANTKGTCTDDNAVCTALTGGKCRCKTDYSENSAGQCSEWSFCFFFLLSFFLLFSGEGGRGGSGRHIIVERLLK